MADNFRAALLQIRFNANNAVLDGARNSLKRLAQGYSELERQEKSFNQVAKQVEATMSKGVMAADKQATAYRELARDAAKAADAQARLKAQNDRFDQVSQNVGLAGDAQSNLSAVRGLAGAAGLTGAASGLDIAGEIVVLAEELPRLKTAIQGLPDTIGAAAQALGPVGLGAAATLGVFTLAFIEFNRRAEEAKSAVQAEANARLRAAEIALTGTRAELEAARDAARQRQQLAADQLALIAAEVAATEEQLTNLELTKDQVLALNSEYYGLIEIQDQLNKQFQTAYTETQSYTYFLDQNATATRDAAAAEEALKEARQANIDKAVDNQVRLLASIGSFSNAGSVDSRVQTLQDERAALQGAIDAGIASNEQLEQYAQRIREINGDISTLQYLIRPVAVEREREAQALRDTETQLKALATAQERFNTDSAALAASLRDSASKNADTVAKIAQQESKALADAASTRVKALAEAEREATNERASIIRDRDNSITEATRKAQIDREKAQRDHQKRLQQIQREFNRSSSQAIADRDAVALQAAEQQRDDAISDEKSAYSERLNEINRALQEENRTINQRYQEQQRTISQRLAEQSQTINQRYSEQVQAAQQAAAAARQAEAQRFAEEQRSIQNQIRLRTNQYNQEIALANAGAQAMIRIEAQKQSILVAQAQSALRALTAGASTGQTATFNRNGTTYAIRAFGGFLNPGQTSRVNELNSSGRETFSSGGRTIAFPGMGLFTPERSGMVNANRGGGGGGFTFAPTINATSKRAIREQVMTELDTMLTQQGIS